MERKKKYVWKVKAATVLCFACCLHHTGSFLSLLFNPEDGGNIFLRNVSSHTTDYTDDRKVEAKTVLCFACRLLHAGPFLSLLFNPKDGGNIFLRNVSSLTTDYTDD
jgi:hypothetical protein